MRIHQQEFEHPTQASRVRLSVFERQPEPEQPVAGMGPREAGFLVTEDRIGTVTVVASLGYFASREEAMARVRSRGRELQEQRHRPLPP